MFGTGMVIMIDTEILYIVGVSAIGAVSLAYVFFGFSSDSSKKSKKKTYSFQIDIEYNYNYFVSTYRIIYSWIEKCQK